MQPQQYLVISMTYPLPVLFVSNLLLSSYFIIADVNYSWFSAKFSDGNFKTVSMVRQPKQPSREQADIPQETSALPSTDDLFSCPQEGCVRVFQRFSSLEQHLSLEACELCPEKYSLLDLAKQEYASRLQEGTGLVPSLHFPASQVLADSYRACKEGWALKGAKKAERFNEAQRSYLEAKFNIGQSTRKKLDPDVVAKEMRRARGPNGDRLFVVTEFLSAQQISSFFSRLAAKARQKEVQVTEQDALAVEEEVNFFTARDRVLSSLHVTHPIVVDQYDLCALVKSKEIKKLKVGLLQVLCESLDLQSPIPPVRRKAPYVSLLQGLVESCSCCTM